MRNDFTIALYVLGITAYAEIIPISPIGGETVAFLPNFLKWRRAISLILGVARSTSTRDLRNTAMKKRLGTNVFACIYSIAA